MSEEASDFPTGFGVSVDCHLLGILEKAALGAQDAVGDRDGNEDWCIGAL